MIEELTFPINIVVDNTLVGRIQDFVSRQPQHPYIETANIFSNEDLMRRLGIERRLGAIIDKIDYSVQANLSKNQILLDERDHILGRLEELERQIIAKETNYDGASQISKKT